MADSERTRMTGKTFSHYAVGEPLGEGATSVVYRAEDLALGREVVLKFLTSQGTDLGAVARFQHEARTISSLNHPNICTIYEIGEHEGHPFLAMELLDGAVLAQLVASRPLDPSQIVDLTAQVADALDAAHTQGIVHRDVKPANIFVTRRGQAKLLDFGLAVLIPRRSRAATGTGSSPSTTGGTVPYMSPEQARADDIDHRTDLFSLGVVLYEMATGRRPFGGATSAEVMDAIIGQPPVPPRDLNPAMPAELARIIEKALEKNARLRYQTASDLRADLQRLRRDLDTVTRTPALPQKTAARAASRRWTTQSSRAIAIAVMLSSGALLLIGVVRNRPGVEHAGLLPSVVVPYANLLLPAASGESTPKAAAAPRPVTTTLPAASASSATPQRESSDHTAAPASHVEEPVAVKTEKEAPTVAALHTSDELRIAREKIALKLYEPALETLRHVAAQTDNRDDAVDASFLIGSVYERRGELDRAMSSYLEVSRRFPDDPRAAEALVRLAESTLRSKRPNNEVDASRALTEVAQRYPSSTWAPTALVLRGELEERRGLYQRDDVFGGSIPTAVLTYRSVLDRYKSSVAAKTALHRLGRLYVEAKRYEAAAEAYRALAERDRDNTFDAWFTAGEICEKRLKDAACARDAYARVPASSPRYAEAQKRLRKDSAR